MSFRDQSILKKGLCLVAAPLVLQIIFISILAVSQRQSEHAEAMAIHSKKVIAKAEESYRLLMQMHNSARGYLITSAEPFRADFDDAAVSLFDRLAELRELVSDNKVQTENAEAIAAAGERLLAWLRETLELVVRGDREGAFDRVAQLEGSKRNADVRSRIDRLLDEESRIERDRFAAVSQARRRQSWGLVAAAVLAITVGSILIVLFSREFSSRVEMLAQNARLLAEGKPLLQPLRGKDELGYLDSVFHGVAHLLSERESENEMFIYSASHDLRSPLLNLKGFSRELELASHDLVKELERLDIPAERRKSIDELLERDVRESVRFIGVSVSRLSGIIDGLLRLSRAGRVEFRFEKVDVESSVRRIVESLRGSTNEKKARIEIGTLPPVWGDARAVEQIFANLITNAVMYLDPARPGLIEVGTVAEEGDVAELHGRPAGRRQTYFVKDNGLGIEDAHKSKLFLVFQRLHPEVAAGEGIGLAIVRRVVERMGGRIWVESVVGEGTTFFVSLLTEPAGSWSGEVRTRMVYGQNEESREKTELVPA